MKRALAILLVLVLIISGFSTSVMAADLSGDLEIDEPVDSSSSMEITLSTSSSTVSVDEISVIIQSDGMISRNDEVIYNTEDIEVSKRPDYTTSSTVSNPGGNATYPVVLKAEVDGDWITLDSQQVEFTTVDSGGPGQEEEDPGWFSQAKAFVNDPLGYLATPLGNAFVSGFAVPLADAISNAFQPFIDAIQGFGEAIYNPNASDASDWGIVNALWNIPVAIVGVIDSTLLQVALVGGPLAPALYFGGWAVLLAVGYKVTMAAIPALTDLLGAVPVIGSILDSILTFVNNFIGRLL